MPPSPFVLHSEIVFPNQLILRIAERKEVFAVKTAADEYCVLDRYGLVLRTGNSAENNIDGYNILVEGIGTDEILSAEIGKKIEVSRADKLTAMTDTVRCLREWSPRYTVEEIRMHCFVGIKFSKEGTKDIVTVQTRLNQNSPEILSHRIVIISYATDMAEKMAVAWAIHLQDVVTPLSYNTIKVSEVKTGGNYTAITSNE